MSETTLTSPSTISPLQAMLKEQYSLLEQFKFPAPGGAYSGYTGSFFKFELGASRNVFAFNVGAFAWSASLSAFDFGPLGGTYSTTGVAGFACNAYYDGANWRAKATGFGGMLEVNAGAITYSYAASVTAGSAQTFVTGWKSDASGNFLINSSTVTNTPTNGVTVTEPTTGKQVGIGHVSGSSSGTAYLIFAYNGGLIGSVTQSGTSAVAYNTSSDYRLKSIAGPVTDSGAFIDALKPCRGTWKSDGTPFVGLLAHEVQAVSPSSVTGTKDAVDDEGRPVHQQMDYSSAEIIANLIAEVKSLRARLAAAGVA